jgi:hypothetical protein
MSELSEQPDLIPEESPASSFMIVLSLLSAIAAVVAFFAGGFLAGLLGLAIAAVFLVLGRALNYLQEIIFRLDRLERKNDKR